MGLPLVYDRGGGFAGAAARLGALPRPWGVGAFRGRRLGGVYGPFWLVLRPSALQGQGRWAFDFRACPGLARASRAVATGGSGLAAQAEKPVHPSRSFGLAG
jgi:hypothetical protein